MTIHVELWHLVSAAFALIGAYFALVKVIVYQFDKSLDLRFDAQEVIRAEAHKGWQEKFAGLQANHDALLNRFNEHVQVVLPEKLERLQRREDAIRGEVNMVNRLDGLAELMREGLRNLDLKFEDLRRSRDG